MVDIRLEHVVDMRPRSDKHGGYMETVYPIRIWAMASWCVHNIDNRNWLHAPNGVFEFRHLADAVLFQLTWHECPG